MENSVGKGAYVTVKNIQASKLEIRIAATEQQCMNETGNWGSVNFDQSYPKQYIEANQTDGTCAFEESSLKLEFYTHGDHWIGAVTLIEKNFNYYAEGMPGNVSVHIDNNPNIGKQAQITISVN